MRCDPFLRARREESSLRNVAATGLWPVVFQRLVHNNEKTAHRAVATTAQCYLNSSNKMEVNTPPDADSGATQKRVHKCCSRLAMSRRPSTVATRSTATPTFAKATACQAAPWLQRLTLTRWLVVICWRAMRTGAGHESLR